MRILIAEDDFTSRTILGAIVSKWGHEPIAVEDGDAAWQILQQSGAPSLAVLDWEMPGMDGLEVCRNIRRLQTANPPYIIILTAKDDKADIVKGLDAGANDYIAKPYDNEELLARIRVGQRMVELQTELLAAKDALAHEARHDSLTKALNRGAILACLEKELERARRNTVSLSIGLFDIDFFKKVNDTYGHQAGDEVLCGFVSTIQQGVRGYDLLGRYGGEEFLVVAPDSTGSAEEGLYERLRAQVADFRADTRSGALAITVSVGVARFEPTATVETMLAAADAALYRAKDQGRNQVVYAP